MPIATIDVGTNTAHLLIAELGAGRVHSLYDEVRFVRLGEGVDAGGRVGPGALARLREALVAYRAEAERWKVDRVVVAGTSASRDAANRAEIVAFVRREVGFDYEILTGEEEARWGFEGAVSAFSDLEGEVAVVDVGGGSTEVIVGTAGTTGADAAAPAYRRSMDVGSVRLTERYFEALPPTAAAVAEARRAVEAALDSAAVPSRPALPLVGAAGTATALGRLYGGEVLPRADVEAWSTRLLGLTAGEVLALDPSVMRGREDVFAAGVLVLAHVVARFGAAALRVSPHGLRHGLALRAARSA